MISERNVQNANSTEVRIQTRNACIAPSIPRPPPMNVVSGGRRNQYAVKKGSTSIMSSQEVTRTCLLFTVYASLHEIASSIFLNP